MRMPSSSESARRGQKSSICEELVLENLTSRKLTWANEKPRWAVLPRRPFQTALSKLTYRTISVHDAEFSAKKGGPVASRRTKRQYHERHFTIGERSRQKLHASHNAYRGKRSLRRVGFSDGRAIGMQGRTRGCASCPVGRLASDGAIKKQAGIASDLPEFPWWR